MKVLLVILPLASGSPPCVSSAVSSVVTPDAAGWAAAADMLRAVQATGQLMHNLKDCRQLQSWQQLAALTKPITARDLWLRLTCCGGAVIKCWSCKVSYTSLCGHDSWLDNRKQLQVRLGLQSLTVAVSEELYQWSTCL